MNESSFYMSVNGTHFILFFNAVFLGYSCKKLLNNF